MFMRKHKEPSSGENLIPSLAESTAFTLIELMVVILIIAVLVGIAIPVYLVIQKKSADRVRLANMRILNDVITRYGFDNGHYPYNTDNDWSGWDGDYDGVFINPLVTSNYLKRAVKDPVSLQFHASGNLHYYRYNAGSYGADPSWGAYFVVGCRDMVTSGRPHPNSPGFQTPGRNWQNEFDWVTGGYENFN